MFKLRILLLQRISEQVPSISLYIIIFADDMSKLMTKSNNKIYCNFVVFSMGFSGFADCYTQIEFKLP